MTPDKFQRADSIFQSACERPEGERIAYVERVCADDQALRSAVLTLLRHDQRTDVPLDAPVGAAAHRMGEALLAGAEAPEMPERIGPYRVLQPLGEGGFGVVYLAEQENPRRTVALKVLRTAVASAAVLRRFEYETRVLARLRHPAIAQIFEAGVAGSGAQRQPYFAMEYIRGRDLLTYAEGGSTGSGERVGSGGDRAGEGDGRSLGTRARLELFVKVCAGVEHAHQSGVIHRDLKPENILVEEHGGGHGGGDGGGQPRILDFGVARILDSDASVTMQTTAGQLVGTLAYMSPEQVAGDPDRIDTRSDVYALGVILFQLLERRLPFDLTRKSLAESIRTIQETPPPPLGSLDRAVRADLQAIVGRALEKDSDRRYPSASHLAGDIQAYLAGRPVTARSPTALYHLKKLAGRHRRLVAVGAVALIALVLGSTGTAWQAIRATGAAARAQIEARKSERINRFLQSMLTSADPNSTRGKEVTVLALLDRTAARVHEELADEPEIEAAVRATLGDTYANLGAFERAETHLREALAIRRRLFGDQNADVAAAAQSLAHVLHATARFPEAFELCAAALETHARLVGRDDVAYARNLVLYADLLHSERSDYAEAERAYREAIAIFTRHDGPRSASTASALGNLGAMLFDLFRFDDAESAMRDSYEIGLEVHGPDHSLSIVNGHNLALLLAARSRSAQAEAVAGPALESALRIYGPGHPETGRLQGLMAELLFDRAELAGAEPLAREALVARRQALPQGHRLTLFSIVLLGDILAASGSGAEGGAAEAGSLANEAIETYRRQGKDQYWPCAEARGVLGASLAATRRFDEAEPLLRDSYETIKQGQGARSRAARAAMRRMIRLYEAWGRPDDAAEVRARLDSLPAR